MNSEQRLIQEACDGDRDAIFALVSDAQAKAKRWIPHRFRLQASDLDDVLQEASGEVLRALSEGRFEYQGEDSFSKYFSRIAERVALRHIGKARNVSLADELPSPEPATRVGDVGPTKLRRAKEALTTETRAAVELRYAGRSRAEVSRFLRLTIGQLKRKLGNGLKQLRKRLGHNR